MSVRRKIETEFDAFPRIEYQKVVLPNGLQIFLHLDQKLPVVHVNQWFHVGSKNEKQGRTGFAHLFEHMMFQGSKHAKDDYFNYVEKAGANLREGGVNGTTDFDRTNYFATVPSGNLEALLWVESDRLATLADALTQEKLDNQREVVRNERRQSYENQPYGRAYMLLTENLHPAGHPYSWDVIGSHEDLIAASLEDVADFFRTFYTPNNLSLCIAGDFDRDQALDLVEKYFGGIPAGPVLDRPTRWVPVLEGERVIEATDRVPQERSYIAWPAPRYFETDEASLDMAARILSEGLSSRLSRRLVYDEQRCTNVFAYNEAREIAGNFVVAATARPGESLETIEAIIFEEIGKIAAEGPTGEELQRTKNKWELEFISGLERIGGFGGKADRLNQYNVYLGDADKLEKDVARYRGVSRESMREAVRRWLPIDRHLTLRFRPEASGRAVGVDFDRASEPALGVDRPFIAPPVREGKLENGIDLFVIERSDLPKVAVIFASRSGGAVDPAGKEGTAHLTVSLVDMGTAKRDALDIERAFGDLGTMLSGTAGRELSMLSFEVLNRNLAGGMELFAEVIREASYPEAEVEREKMRHLDSLAQQANNPSSVASRLRGILAFGREHPYGRPLQGFPSSVREIGRDDLLQFHQTQWKPGSSALIFAGDISFDDAKELAEKYFGPWQGAPAERTVIPPRSESNRGKIFLVDRQDAPQTVLMQILPAPGRRTKDSYALRLVDAVWGGGGFGTRLNLNLREDKGYSYGVFSSLGFLSEAGSWWAHGNMQTDKTRESFVELSSELEDLAGRKPITAKELADAKATRTRGYSQQFESLGRIAGQVADLWSVGLPMSELQREYDETAGTGMDAVVEAVRRHLAGIQPVYLLVGDLSKIEEGICSLGPEVIVLDEEGNVKSKD